MKMYVITSTSASDYPSTAAPMVTGNRELAGKTWMDWVVEELGYPDDDPDIDDVEMVRSLVRDWIENPDNPNFILEWTVGNDGPVDEMMTYEVHTVDVPSVQPVTLRSGRQL